jgi:endonuclease/exonuclease/phosphatase family metal-dependent hydrolase
MAEDFEKWDYPAAVMGDMNAYPHSAAICAFLSDEKVPLVNQTPHFPSSYHGFGTVEAPQIDYIFTRGFKATEMPVAWDKKIDGKFLSDHNPLCVFVEAE